MSVKLMAKAWDLKNLTPGQKLLFLALCDHANDDGLCYPSQETLKNKCGLGKASLTNSLKMFESLGILRRERRQKGGQRYSDLYFITLDNFDSEGSKSERSECKGSKSKRSEFGGVKVQNLCSEGSDFEPCYKEEPSMNHQIEPSDIKREIKTAAENAQAKPSAKRGSNHADQMRMLTDRGVDEQVAADYLQIRAAKRSPLTQTALAGIEREAAKANLTLTQALVACTERGWLIAKDEWLRRDVVSTGKTNSKPSVKDIPKHTLGGAFPATEIWK